MTADERLWGRWLAEGVDAGVVGVAVIVFHVGEGRIRGDLAGEDLSVTWVMAKNTEGVEAF